MDAWWIGTVSTLAGIVTAALLQAWRDRTTYQRQLDTRWDQALLDGLTAYLSTADRAVRTLLQWREARDHGHADLDVLAAQALEAFETLHERSHTITLLTGDRANAVRALSRQMRAPLLAMRDEVLGGRSLTSAETAALVSQHRDARAELIDAAQRRLGVPVHKNQSG